MRPFQGYGHFCTRCGHKPVFHTALADKPIYGYPQNTACALPDCTCRFYYEGGDA